VGYGDRRVSDRADPATLRALLADATLRKRMVALALSRIKPWQNQRAIALSPIDVVHEAMAKVLSGKPPWEPDKKTLEQHLGSVVNTVAWHAVNTAAARRNDGYDAATHERFAVDAAPAAVDRLIDHEEDRRGDARRARCWDELVAELGKREDQEAIDVLGLMHEEVLEYEEQAKRLKKKLPEIKLAHKRITYHARLIAERARRRDDRGPDSEVTT
jgi:hypothetical protein